MSQPTASTSKLTDPLPHGLPLRFSDLSIEGGNDSDQLVPTLGSSLLDAITLGPVRRLVSKKTSHNETFLISGVEGIVHQGEMLLIVGPPSANTSTLLRALSSPNDITLSKSSRLDYGLLGPKSAQLSKSFSSKNNNSDAGLLRSQVAYLNPHDVHFATLSVSSSLLPNAKSKAPNKKFRKPNQSRAQWGKTKLEELLAQVGLSHTWDTKIGSAIVHGLSGGERKRASLVETLLTRASVLCLDSFTSGLDSSTAQSLIEYLKSSTKQSKRSLVATTPHISDPLYELFDKVLVLSSSGQQIYFGPSNEAQSYFESLGRGFKRRDEQGEGVAEFLVSCTEGRGNDRKLVRDWKSSEMRKKLLAEWKDYENRYSYDQCAGPLLEAVKEEKSKYARGHFIVSFPYQIILLTRRQYALIYSELPSYVTKTTVNLLLSVTVGSLFFRLPPTSNGAFTRGSLLLLSIMFNAYLSLAELGKAIEGRDTVKRQGDYGFFGSSALAVARVMGDLPLILAQCLLFGTVTYFMAGLQPHLWNFVVYIIFIYATALNLSSMFRMFAAFSPDFESAIRFCGICLNVLVIFAGYFIPTPSMNPNLRWFHYILDPIARSYEAVLANEFHDLYLQCSPDDIVPRGSSYVNDPQHQACLLSGSKPNTLKVLGDDYLATAFDFHHSRIWTNLGVMAIQAVVFLIIGVVATEFLHFAPEGSKRIWKGTKAVKRRFRKMRGKGEGEEESLVGGLVNVEMEEEEGGFDAGEESIALEGSTLVWRNVCLWVDTPNETRRLLDHVSGYIKPGRVCSLMGASGAGKSTLLNVLAGRPPGVVRGRVLVDGLDFDDEVRRTTAFAEQFDLHDDRATVREALEFSALLRTPPSLSRSEKLSYVDEVLDLLNLTHLQDAIIGTSHAGLNPEQRKRATIAVEVVSRPRILFCDEPTTGLDSKAANRVVKLLKRLSRTGLAVICTIHQPSSETFNEFDDVLLLQKGGKQVYFGKRSAAVEYFTKAGFANNHANPADYLLDAAGAGISTSSDSDSEENEVVIPPSKDLALRWRNSKESLSVENELTTLSLNAVKPVTDLDTSKTMLPDDSSNDQGSQSVSNWYQCVELTKRVSKHYWRDPSFSYTKLFTSSIVPLVIGLSFYGVGREKTIVSFNNRLFSVFLLLFVPVVWLNVIIFKIFKLRGLWMARERPSKIYGRTAFVTSLLVSEIPYSIVCGTLYFCIWYFLVGFPNVPSTIGYAFLLIQIFFLFQSTWAFWIVALSQELGTIANLLPFFLVSMEAFNGSLMPYAQMPAGWKWLYWISPFQYYVRAMLGALLHGQPVECGPLELATFDPPANQTCSNYLSEYLSSHSGYLNNPGATSACSFCRFSNGDDFLSSINLSFNDRWWAVSVLGVYCILNIIFGYVLVFYPLQSWVPGLKKGGNALGGGGKAEDVAESEYEAELETRRQEMLLTEGVRI